MAEALLSGLMTALREESLRGYLLRASLFLLGNVIFARIIAGVLWRLAVSVRRTRPISNQRRKTLRYLIHSLMNGVAIFLSLVMIAAMFVDTAGLLTALGLFSAGLGFGARPFVSDFLGGLVFVFEDQFAIGEKVELGDRNVVGVVERVSLRTLHIRGESGELWIVPNGDIRTVRNFSRGNFSPASIRVTVPTRHLELALAVFDRVAAEPGENVLRRPEIISEDGDIAKTTTLLLKVQARHGHAPEVRRRLLNEIFVGLREAGVTWAEEAAV